MKSEYINKEINKYQIDKNWKINTLNKMTKLKT